MSSTMSNAEFLPDLRGNYVIDRWVRYAVSEDLTYRFFVSAAGLRPVSVISGSSAVGSQATLDASASSSPEARTLVFSWRLTTRPRDSSATLIDTQLTTTSFVADAAGLFEVELAVFDGELWSDPHARISILAEWTTERATSTKVSP
jgi:hypothetical protein